jgi:hypothetical protein
MLDAAGNKYEETFTLNPSSVCDTLLPINSTVRI